MTETTPDAATTVRRLLDAFLAGGAETFMSYIDDDIEWNPAEHHPFLTHQYIEASSSTPKRPWRR
jgi:hypothetical protein